MPNVFVYPPEEDDCPPFCCFDAAQSIPSNSPTQADLDAPGSALDFVSQSIHPNTPAFYRRDVDSLIMPRRRNPAVYFHEDQEQIYSDDISIRGSSPGNDSEIAEVVKVRRRHEAPRSASDSTSKQSKSLRARASKAFSSLRIGRSASRSRKAEEELPSESTSRAPSPSPIPRRPSIVLSSLFTRPSSPSLQTSTSNESLTEVSPPSPTSPVTPNTISSGDSVVPEEIHTPASGDMHTFVPYASDSDDEDEDEEDDAAQRQPVESQLTPRASQCFNSPTTPSSRVGRRRFSVLNLFSSFSSQPESSNPVISSSPSTPTLPVMSRDSLGPSSDSCESAASSASSTGPTTPTEGTFPPLDQARTGGNSLLRRLPSLTKKKSSSSGQLTQSPLVVQISNKPSELDNINETSFSEMRLDSLHFSDLSFDADKF
ncbi:hypothetical protein PM082_012804 [Marasmius tenuissimus]|nr:hypothetical protein PM082_012804 [Marasmius tenuissimus]